jgi:hypothetical protein
MIDLLLHEPRQRRSWLIFDVRQKMSLWRKTAVEVMPSLRSVVTSKHITGPMALWIELHLSYSTGASASPVQTAVLDEVWTYIRWCRDVYKSDDMWSAVTVAFFEHLLDERAVREDLPLRISLKEAEESVVYSTYFHSADDVDRYLEWFSNVQRGESVASFRLRSNA